MDLCATVRAICVALDAVCRDHLTWRPRAKRATEILILRAEDDDGGNYPSFLAFVVVRSQRHTGTCTHP